MVGVRVGDHEQAHVVDAQVDHLHGVLEVGERAGLVHPRVHQDDAVARRERPGVAVGDAGPRQR